MALKFNCPKCNSEIIVKYLKPGEMAKCRQCQSEAIVPADALTTDEGPTIVQPGLRVDVLTSANADQPVSGAAERKSLFVTVLAWIFIVMSGMQTCMSIPMNIMVNIVSPFDMMEKDLNNPQMNENIPAIPRFMFMHFRLIFFAMLVFVSITFISSICLLKRKDWARKFFIGFMMLGIASNLLSLGLQLWMFSLSGANAMMLPMLAFTLILVTGFTVLYVWIIKKLMSDEIRKEFN